MNGTVHGDKRMTLCGADCGACMWKDGCGGCKETGGRPFGGVCVLAECCRRSGRESCASCNVCGVRTRLIEEFNALKICGMQEVCELYALKGEFVNLSYTLPGGQQVKLWQDGNIYLGAQLCKEGSDRCYGLAADENHLLVCEYGEKGSDAEIVLFKRREGAQTERKG